MITIKNYVSVDTVEEAYDLNKKRNNQVLGGMCWLKMMNKDVNTAIDLSKLNVKSIDEDETCFRIGAYVTLRELEMSTSFNEYTNGGMKKAVEHIVGVQFRNCATIGGSIWGRFGFSDLLTFFLSLDAKVELYPTGIVSLKEFRDMKVNNDILLSVIVDKKPLKVAYQTIRNQSTDFPVLACACSNVDGKYNTAIGARPGKAMLVEDDNNILAEVNEETIKAYSEYVMNRVDTISDSRASGEYRKRMVKVLVSRCMKEMEGI
ncbi:MAG: FAD binding domain-containing protein [Firmicutes bacterium]|nr:FAD binding domain-containing protein [Bacillota bacterium]